MAAWQAVGRWAAVLAAAVLLAAPGFSSEPPAPVQKAEAPVVATPADGAVPAWAKVSQLQIDCARKVGVPVAKELDLGGGVTMKLVLIPAGKFIMGSPDSEKGRDKEEDAQHEVTLSKPFYMGVTEVTQAQYQAIMGTNPSQFKGETNPVDSVSWNDATEFCKELSEKTRQAVRLPTEAEWEYACRAGTATHFSFGDDDSALGNYAWYSDNSGETTHPVGQKKPNTWGLYDIHGNVWEWCADWYGDYPNGALTDPQGPASGTYRVLRGGSWIFDPATCRSALRIKSIPEARRNDYFGFRVVVSVSARGYSSKPEPSQSNTGQAAKKDVSIAPSASQVEPPKELTLGLGGGVTMKLVFIPAGKFMMGSPDSEGGHRKNEGPQHEVTLSKPFYMGVTEVTQAQYQAIMGTNPSHFKGATNPVEMVYWNDATEFCKKLSEKTRQPVRLPTEAEWEYACRAGTATAFSFSDFDSALGNYAWFGNNSGETTHPVGQKKPNAWGLYDMHGNVEEWCADWYGDYPNGAVTDPQGPTSGAGRVLRGGSLANVPTVCRSANRSGRAPVLHTYDFFGFRVVVSVSAPGL